MKRILSLNVLIILGVLLEFFGIAYFIVHKKNELNNPKIEIYSVFHKDFPIFKNDIVILIHAGRALKRDFGRPLLNKMIGDNTGVNISEKNNRYAELTVMYWIWKNSKADYVGLMHYRRSLIIDTSFLPEVNQHRYCYNYLCVLGITHSNIAALLKHYDIIVHEKVTMDTSIRMHYYSAHEKEDLLAATKYIQKHYPHMYKVTLDTLYDIKFSNMNLFIMRKDIYDKYCEWLFDILFHIEPELSYKRGYQERAAGFLSERLLTIWLNYQSIFSHYRITYAPVNMFDEADAFSSITFNEGNSSRIYQ